MDTQWRQSAQYADYYVSANNSGTSIVQAQSTQSTESTQRGIHLEDFIELDDTAANSDMPYTFTQPRDVVGSSTNGHGSWSIDHTLDIFHSSANILEDYTSKNADTSNQNSSRTENMLYNLASHEVIPSTCAIVDCQQWPIMPSLLESFEPLSPPFTGSASPLPVTTSPQQPGATSQGHMMLSQDGNHQLNVKLCHDDTMSFYTIAAAHDNRKTLVFQLLCPMDMAPEVNYLPNGVCSVSWKKL